MGYDQTCLTAAVPIVPQSPRGPPRSGPPFSPIVVPVTIGHLPYSYTPSAIGRLRSASECRVSGFTIPTSPGARSGLWITGIGLREVSACAMLPVESNQRPNSQEFVHGNLSL